MESWKLKNLVERYQTANTTVASVTEIVADPSASLVDLNIACHLSNVHDSVSGLIRNLSRHKRTAATHVFVFMISSEQQRLNPMLFPYS